MSPLHAHSLVADLVEMARATEELPKVQRELDLTIIDLSAARDTITDRELRIIELKREIEELNTRVRNAEVARDDAEFRFLESEDKALRVLDKLSGIMGFADSIQRFVHDAREVIEPPKPVPEAPAIETITEAELLAGLEDITPQGQSEANPTATVATQESNVMPSEPMHGTFASTTESAPEVATPPDPTASSTVGDGLSPAPVDMTNAPSVPDAASQEPSTTQAEPDPYADEPFAKYSDAWYAWAGEMDKRYGYAWPDRKVA